MRLKDFMGVMALGAVGLLMAAAEPLTVAKATAADQAAINQQKVCKISGGSLGSMGTPIKISQGNKKVFLCCQGCVKKVRANPEKYLK